MASEVERLWTPATIGQRWLDTFYWDKVFGPRTRHSRELMVNESCLYIVFYINLFTMVMNSVQNLMLWVPGVGVQEIPNSALCSSDRKPGSILTVL